VEIPVRSFEVNEAQTWNMSQIINVLKFIVKHYSGNKIWITGMKGAIYQVNVPGTFLRKSLERPFMKRTLT
jgi:hypothetical protein